MTFINDGAEDKLAGNMINFRKRQKAAEVIQDIKRWQAKPYNFQTVTSVLQYLEESFQQYTDGVDYGDQFWHLSLEREPREREDEKDGATAAGKRFLVDVSGMCVPGLCLFCTSIPTLHIRETIFVSCSVY